MTWCEARVRYLEKCLNFLSFGSILLVVETKLSRKMQTDSFENSRKWLKKSKLRPTRQRLSLANLLVGDGKNRHVTAESLFELANNSGGAVSLATVYNTLKAFCDAGLLNEVTVDGHKSYFDTRMDDHPHFYWEQKGLLTDAPKNSLQISQLPDAPNGSEITKVDVVIRLREK